MRRVAADYIFPVSGPPLKNGIIEFDDQGEILSLTDTRGNFKETSKLEYYNGVLVPGLILPYCRIEPYIFRIEITDGASLKRFITRELETLKPSSVSETRFKDLDIMLKKSGVSGIGCITNRFHFFRKKSEGVIQYHSFIEIAPQKKTAAFDLFNKAIGEIMTGWNDYGLPSSVIPFYGNSDEVMDYISDFSIVHENPLIFGYPGIQNNPSSILNNFSAILARLTGREKSQVIRDFRNSIIILTYDLVIIPDNMNNNTFLLLPTDNPHVTDNLPIERDLWARLSGNILFSRYMLNFTAKASVVSDMILLQNKLKWLSFEDLIRCFTLNPARALKMDKKAGSLFPGKKPGINLITNFNFDEFKLTGSSEIKPIV